MGTVFFPYLSVPGQFSHSPAPLKFWGMTCPGCSDVVGSVSSNPVCDSDNGRSVAGRVARAGWARGDALCAGGGTLLLQVALVLSFWAVSSFLEALFFPLTFLHFISVIVGLGRVSVVSAHKKYQNFLSCLFIRHCEGC